MVSALSSCRTHARHQESENKDHSKSSDLHRWSSSGASASARQTGQVECIRSRRQSMQRWWKTCRHAGNRRAISHRSTSSLHTAHASLPSPEGSPSGCSQAGMMLAEVTLPCTGDSRGSTSMPCACCFFTSDRGNEVAMLQLPLERRRSSMDRRCSVQKKAR